MIKLIMSDMDGTLLDENGNVPEGFDGIIAQLKERGAIFAPASGRQYFSLLESFKGYANDFLFFAENGTFVKYQGRELFSSPMDLHMVFAVLRDAEKLPGILRVYCGKKDAYILKSQEKPAYLAELRKYYTHCSVVEDFRQIDDEAIKVSLFDESAQAATKVYPQMSHFQGRLQVALSSAYWVDIMNYGINKGIAVQQVQKRLGIAPMACAAFGDYLNDLEMMSSVYYSYAMGNAHPKVKAAAREVIQSNAEHGVLKKLQELLDEKMI